MIEGDFTEGERFVIFFYLIVGSIIIGFLLLIHFLSKYEWKMMEYKKLGKSSVTYNQRLVKEYAHLTGRARKNFDKGRQSALEYRRKSEKQRIIDINKRKKKEQEEQKKIYEYQLSVGMVCPHCKNFVGTARPYICPHCQEPIPKNIDHKVETRTDKMIKELDKSFKEWNKRKS